MPVEDDVERARRLIAEFLGAAGVTRIELDDRLGKSRGSVSQGLSGRMELRLSFLLAVLDELDIDPRLYCALLFPGQPRRPNLARRSGRGAALLERLEAASLGPAPPEPPPGPPLTAPQIEALIMQTIKMVMGEPDEPAPLPGEPG